jgi:hypothetical protein
MNSPNRNKNIQYRWEESAKYGSELNLSEGTLSIENSCNDNNDDSEEMIWGKRKRKLLDVR